MIDPLLPYQRHTACGILLEMTAHGPDGLEVWVHIGGTHSAKYDEALRLGMVDGVMLNEDHVSWLRSMESGIEEWDATWKLLV